MNDVKFKCNKFYGSAKFIVNNSSITPQIYFGNEWLGWPIGTHNLHPAPFDAQCVNCIDVVYTTLSHFFMHEQQSSGSSNNYTPYYPSHPSTINPDQNDEWFQYIQNQSPNCAFNLTHTSEQIEAADYLVSENLDSIFDSHIANDVAKRSIYYSQSYVDTALQNSSVTLNDFYNSFLSTNIGELHNFNILIEQSHNVDSAHKAWIQNAIDTMEVYLLDTLYDLIDQLDTNYTVTQTVDDYISVSNQYMNTGLRLAIILSNLKVVQDSQRMIILDNLNNYESADTILQNEVMALKILIKDINNLEIDTSESEFAIGLANSCPSERGLGTYIARTLILCNYNNEWPTCHEFYVPDEELKRLDNVVQENSNIDQTFVPKVTLQESVYLLFTIEGKFLRKVSATDLLYNLSIPRGVYLIQKKGENLLDKKYFKWVKN